MTYCITAFWGGEGGREAATAVDGGSKVGDE